MEDTTKALDLELSKAVALEGAKQVAALKEILEQNTDIENNFLKDVIRDAKTERDEMRALHAKERKMWLISAFVFVGVALIMGFMLLV